MSDMTLSEAAAEAGKFGNTVRAFAKLQETAQALVANEQLWRERKTALDKLGADAEKAKADLASAQAAVQDAKDQAAAIIKNAKDAAASASQSAKDVIAARAADAEATLQEARKATAEQLATATGLANDIAAARSTLADIQSKIDQAKAEARARFE